jgi:hypothetical protein
MPPSEKGRERSLKVTNDFELNKETSLEDGKELTCEAKTSNPPDRTREYPLRNESPSFIHEDRVHWSYEETNA